MRVVFEGVWGGSFRVAVGTVAHHNQECGRKCHPRTCKERRGVPSEEHRGVPCEERRGVPFAPLHSRGEAHVMYTLSGIVCPTCKGFRRATKNAVDSEYFS